LYRRRETLVGSSEGR